MNTNSGLTIRAEAGLHWDKTWLMVLFPLSNFRANTIIFLQDSSQVSQASNPLKAVSKCREGVPRKVPKACQKASRGLSAGWQLSTFGLPRGTARLCQMPPARHIPTLFGPIFRSSFSQKLRLIVCSPASNATRNWDGLLNLALNGSYLWKNPSVEGLILRYPCERVLISNCPLQRAFERRFDLELSVWKGSNLARWGATSPNRARAGQALHNNLELTASPLLSCILSLLPWFHHQHCSVATTSRKLQDLKKGPN